MQKAYGPEKSLSMDDTLEQVLRENALLKTRLFESETALAKALERVEQLAVERDRLESLVNHGALAVAEVDPSGKAVGCNRNFETLFGWSAHQITGQILDDLIEDPSKPGEARAFTEKALDGASVEGTGRRRRSDSFLMEVAFFGAPVIVDGKIVGAYGLYHDISAQVHAEKKLEKHLSLLQATLEATAEAIIAVDVGGKITAFNQRFLEIFQFPGKAAVPQDLEKGRELLLDKLKDPEDYLKKTQAVYSRPKEKSADVIELADGRVLERFSHPQVLGGEIVGRVWSLRDITSRIQAENRLNRACGALFEKNRRLEEKRVELNRMVQQKETLLREVHHRVKNNMQIMVSLLRLQAREYAEPRLSSLLREVQNRIHSLAMVHDKVYRTEGFEGIDFGAYVNDISKTLVESFGGHGIDLEIQVESVGIAMASAIPLGLILNELISNAVKYAFPGAREGRIFISLKNGSEKGIFHLVFKDNGIGFPEDLDPDNPITLGLKLVKVLVKQMGGTCRLRRGRGTEWNIRFQEKPMAGEGGKGP